MKIALLPDLTLAYLIASAIGWQPGKNLGKSWGFPSIIKLSKSLVKFLLARLGQRLIPRRIPVVSLCHSFLLSHVAFLHFANQL